MRWQRGPHLRLDRSTKAVIAKAKIEKAKAAWRHHQVLSAKHHKSESGIVREPGRPGAVTIAINMAGRGTDIKLGERITEPRGVR